MDLLSDECVPRSVSEFFEQRRHRVRYVEQELGQNTPDRVVAEFANEQELILVTWNVRDFRNLGIVRRSIRNQQQYRRAGMISFVCEEDQGARRAAQVIETLEFEYEQAMRRSDKRLLVAVHIDRIIIEY